MQQCKYSRLSLTLFGTWVGGHFYSIGLALLDQILSAEFFQHLKLDEVQNKLCLQYGLQLTFFSAKTSCYLRLKT